MPYLASPLTLNHEWLIRNMQRLHVGMIRELIKERTSGAPKRALGKFGPRADVCAEDCCVYRR